MPISKDALWGAFLLWNLAEIYVELGERDAAIDQLEILVTSPFGITVPWLRRDPFWAPLRGHPRFERLIQAN